MKITLRKKDSVISIILFIFNIYKEYSNKYSIKLSSLIGMIKFFDKSEASIRTGLSRMVKSGIIITNGRQAGEIIYELTKEGIEILAIWNKGLKRFFSRYALRQEEWKGIWYLLSIYNFNKSDYANQYIVDELKECGLREINNNIWATAYPVNEDVFSLLNDKFDYFVLSGSIQTGSNFSRIINNTFETDDLKQKYCGLLDLLNKTANQISTNHSGMMLPVLFETGWSFYDVVTSDPVVPKEIVSQWEGDKAVSKMGRIRPLLYQEVVHYFKESNI